MLATLRLSIWLVAILFAVSPVALGIASSPGNVPKLFEIDSYADVGRDLIFSAIAVLAVGLIDTFEVISTSVRQKKSTKLDKARLFFSILLALGIIIQLVLYAHWSQNPKGLEIASVLIRFFSAATICAFFARLTLISGN
jgi:hypothetical protein